MNQSAHDCPDCNEEMKTVEFGGNQLDFFCECGTECFGYVDESGAEIMEGEA